MRIPIHIVAPYEAMVPIIQECVPLFPNLDIHYAVGDLVKGVEHAKTAERNGAAIIISRGGTAQLIKRSVTIPVIDMQLSGYDMIRSLTLANHSNYKTAIVGFSNITSGAQSIIDVMDLPLQVYTISNSEEVAPLIVELKASGYHHIVGDAITSSTANAYGLNGFLIQSGKESIIKSLEDAQLLYSYLNKNNTVSSIFNSLVMKEHPNIGILNEHNDVIYEHYTQFDQNPLSEEHIHLINADLAFNQTVITNSFIVDDIQLSVTAYETVLANNTYKVLLFEKVEPNLFSLSGITAYADTFSEPIANTSHAMQATLNCIEALHKQDEVIHLQGPQGAGKSFIVRYVHQKFAAGGILLRVDLSQFKPDQLSKIPLTKVRNIEIIHAEQCSDTSWLQSFIESCLVQHIGIFVLSEQPLDTQYVQHLRLNTIMIPSLSERAEDIPDLIQYFLTDYYHKYGTTAVKIKDDALQRLMELAPDLDISRLKSILKQAALNEKDYVITMETLNSVLTEHQKAMDPLPLQGTLKEIEIEVINRVLKEENFNQSRAAERLGINRATLWRKLKE